MLAVRIHLLRIFGLSFGGNSIVPAVALHAGFMAIFVDLKRALGGVGVAGIAFDAVACMSVGEELCRLCLC